MVSQEIKVDVREQRRGAAAMPSSFSNFPGEAQAQAEVEESSLGMAVIESGETAGPEPTTFVDELMESCKQLM